jgi:hypothetical protein
MGFRILGSMIMLRVAIVGQLVAAVFEADRS